MNIWLIYPLAILLVANISAESEQCPPNGRGEYPKCECPEKDYPYDPVNNICPIKINFESQDCPTGSVGQFPNCVCGVNKIYNIHINKCVDVDRDQCPTGSTKVNNRCVCEPRNNHKYEFDEIFWVCRPWYLPTPKPAPPQYYCPLNQHFDKLKNDCVWSPCPAGYTNGYWPNCTAPPTCGSHQTGIHPNCEWDICPPGYRTKTGKWPDCHYISCTELANCPPTQPSPSPCLPHHYRNKYGECVRIPCPAPNEDKYQPDCPIFKPSCPPEYPGDWPFCNIYAPTYEPNTMTTTKTTTSKPPEMQTPKVPETPTCSNQCHCVC